MKLFITFVILSLFLSGCATWEAKLDQRLKWKKFREESPNSIMTPFKKWPAEK